MSATTQSSYRRSRRGKDTNTNLQVHIPDRFKLSNQQKKHYATVAELKPDWTEEEIVDFCRKCSFNSTVIQEGLANAFEDSRPHKEICANDWNLVDKKPRNKLVKDASVEEGHRPHKNNRKQKETPVPAPVVESRVGDSRVETTEEGAAPVVVDQNNNDNNAPVAPVVDNNKKPVRVVGERKPRVNARKASTDKAGEVDSSSLAHKERRQRWKKQPRSDDKVSLEKPAVQDKSEAPLSAPQRPVSSVPTLQQKEGVPKLSYAGLLKRVANPSTVAPEPVVVESTNTAPVVEQPEQIIPESEEVAEIREEEVEIKPEPEVLEQAQGEEIVETSQVEEPSVVEEVSAPAVETPARVAIIEDSDAYLPASKISSATPPTPIGPTPKKHAHTHIQVPSIKSSASRSVWRVKESQPMSVAPTVSSSAPTPPPSPSELRDAPTQSATQEVESTFYEHSQEIIKDISAHAVQQVESSSKDEAPTLESSSSSTFEFGFGLSSGAAPASFSSISDNIVPVPHEVESAENAEPSSFVEEDPTASQLEGLEAEFTDEMFDHLDNSNDFASQFLSMPAQYPGYRAVPGVLPTSPYVVHTPGAIPAPYFMMTYEPDGTPSHPAAMNPNFYDPYPQRRPSRNQVRPAQRQNSKQSGPTVTPAARPSGSVASSSTTSQYRPKVSNSRAPRSDRRDTRVKDNNEHSFNETSGMASTPQVSKDNRATGSSSNNSAIGSKRQGVIQRANYPQAPHQVPSHMAMYPYPYAMPYSPQYAPVPFPGYVYAGPAGAPYSYMYPSGAPAAGAQVGAYDEDFSQSSYGAATEQIPAPVDASGARPVPSHMNAPQDSARQQLPGAYPQVLPLAMFDAPASWQHHPELLNDPSVAAAAAADYSMMHMMNAPTGYMDYSQPQGVASNNASSSSNMGYDPREYNASSPSNGSYYRISPFNGGNASSASQSGSKEQSQSHHGHAPLSFQQWNHQSQ